MDITGFYELVSLRGKTALVTGAAAGIGRAVAVRFAEAGSGLILVDINAGGLESLHRELTEFKTPVETHIHDMSQASHIDSLWKEMDHIPDILVNNVGIYPPQGYLTLKDSLWQKIMDTNLNSTHRMCQKFIKHREKAGGTVINIASVEALIPFAADLVHYDVSKAGIIALTRALAKEFAVKGFRINAIMPGGIDTPGTREVAERIWKKFDVGLIPSGVKFQSRLPLRRRGKPDEVARVALFLASELSSYVQGALIPVDGGFLSS